MSGSPSPPPLKMKDLDEIRARLYDYKEAEKKLGFKDMDRYKRDMIIFRMDELERILGYQDVKDE